MSTTGRVVYSVGLVLLADIVCGWSPVLLTPMIVLAVFGRSIHHPWLELAILADRSASNILLNIIPALALLATTQSITGRADGELVFETLRGEHRSLPVSLPRERRPRMPRRSRDLGWAPGCWLKTLPIWDDPS